MKRSILVSLALALPPAAGSAADGDLEVAKQGQNPVAYLGALELVDEVSFGLGQRSRTGNLFEIRGALPFTTSLSATVLRATVPFVWRPVDYASRGGSFGSGDITAEAFFTPVEQRVLSVGVGPALRFPTAGDTPLGAHKWSAGPALAVVAAPGPLVLGFSAANLWSYAGSRRYRDVNQLELRPIVAFHFGGGWSAFTAPRVVIDWGAAGADRFTIPVGAGVSKLFGLGSARVALSLEGHAPARWPRSAFDDHGQPLPTRPDFSVRLGARFLFPVR